MDKGTERPQPPQSYADRVEKAKERRRPERVTEEMHGQEVRLAKAEVLPKQGYVLTLKMAHDQVITVDNLIDWCMEKYGVGIYGLYVGAIETIEEVTIIEVVFQTRAPIKGEVEEWKGH